MQTSDRYVGRLRSAYVARAVSVGGVDADVVVVDDAVDAAALVVGDGGDVGVAQHGADGRGACDAQSTLVIFRHEKKNKKQKRNDGVLSEGRPQPLSSSLVLAGGSTKSLDGKQMG